MVLAAAALGESADAGIADVFVLGRENGAAGAAAQVIGAAAAGILPQGKGIADGIGAAGLGEDAAAGDADILGAGRQAAAAEVIGAAGAGVAAQVEIDEADIAAATVKRVKLKVPPVW